MKIEFLVFCLLLLTINCSSSEVIAKCTAAASSTKKKDCTSINTDSDPDYYCCFYEYKYKNDPPSGVSKEGKGCTLITKSSYNNIKNEVDTTKETSKKAGYEYSKYKINCQSAFLKIGLVSLIIGLLF